MGLPVPSPAVPVVLRDMTAADLAAVSGWFADPETIRWLGGYDWPRRLLELAARSPDRFALAGVRAGAIVGVLDVERAGDGRADVALVVAPAERRAGVATGMIRALLEHSALAGVVEVRAGVETGNAASEALVRRAGFEPVADGPDAEGFVYFVRRTDATRPAWPSDATGRRTGDAAT